MSSIPIPRDENALHWARGALGIGDSTAPEDYRGTILERLEEMEFVPPAQWEQAVLILADESPSSLWQRDLGFEMYRSREIALRKEIELFTRNFFVIPPAERRKQHRELSEQCGFSLPLTQWMDSLKTGLDAEPKKSNDSNQLARELADYFPGVFLLPPHLREAHNAELLSRAAYEPAKWQKAALRMRKNSPEVATLIPTLSNTLCNYVKIRAAENKAAAQRIQAQAKTQARVQNSGRAKNFFWIVPVVVILATNLIRALNDNHSPSKPDYSASSMSRQGNRYGPNSKNQYPPFPVGSHQNSADPFAAGSTIMTAQELTPEVNRNELRKTEIGPAFKRIANIPKDAEVYYNPITKIFYYQEPPKAETEESGDTPIYLLPPSPRSDSEP